jgi:hypothetical protein
MMRMNEIRPVKIEKSIPPAMGTAFAVEREKKALTELYSLMKPLADLIVNAQA